MTEPAAQCELVSLPAGREVATPHLYCKTCSALVPITPTLVLEPGVCPGRPQEMSVAP